MSKFCWIYEAFPLTALIFETKSTSKNISKIASRTETNTVKLVGAGSNYFSEEGLKIECRHYLIK